MKFQSTQTNWNAQLSPSKRAVSRKLQPVNAIDPLLPQEQYLNAQTAPPLNRRRTCFKIGAFKMV